MKCGEETFLYFFLHSQKKIELINTLKMLFSLKHTFIIAATFLLNIELCFCACARAEYEINGECCPMCAPGSRVYRHCTEFISTTCVPCVDSTFITEPNGLLNCHSCTVCDSGQGLKGKTACTRTSDTVCEALEGFYCTNYEEGGCTQAVEHTKCSPGQYIKQKGTAHKDAECAGCKNGTYSDGSQEICKQHTKCEDLGLSEIKPGTTMSDVECGKKIQPALIGGIIAAIVLVAGALVMLLKIRHKIGRCAANIRNAETDSEKHETPTSQTPLQTPFQESSPCTEICHPEQEVTSMPSPVITCTYEAHS